MQAETAVLLTDVVGEAAHPFRGEIDDYNPLMELIGEASLVLIGEASHGTHEFYRERAQITKRLIKEKGFTAVAVEADWPDAYRVNRYVQGLGRDADAVEALAGFKRFPAWMWRNADVLDFVGWLRTYNDDLPASAMKVGFTAWTSTVCTLPSGPYWIISSELIRRRRSVLALVTRASIILGRMSKPMDRQPG